MEIKKLIQCTTDPLEDLLENKNSIDFRLDEDTWKTINIGDYIEYFEDFSGWDTEPQENARRVIAQITNISHAKTFQDLFEILDDNSSRIEDKEDTLKNLRIWWDEEKEKKVGVLAFHTKSIKQIK